MKRTTQRHDYPDGGWSECHYCEAELDGLWTVYFPNGRKRWEREYRGGQQHGYERTWSPESLLLDEKTFVAGRLHGPWRIWYSAGVLKQESWFENGNQEGEQQHWRADGSALAYGTIRRGLRNGTFLVDILNDDETATVPMIAEFRDGTHVASHAVGSIGGT